MEFKSVDLLGYSWLNGIYVSKIRATIWAENQNLSECRPISFGGKKI